MKIFYEASVMRNEKRERRAKVITIANQKGGVAKSTNAIHVAAGLAELGRKSLIIDLDASAGATKKLGAPLVGWNTTFELVNGEEEALNCIITDEDEEVRLPKNIHLVPAGKKLDRIDPFLLDIKNAGVIQQNLLLEPIDKLRGEYDYIILDTPPLVTKYTFPAYKAADYVILSTELEKLSVDALNDANQLIASVRKHGNSKLQLIGVIVNMVPKPLTRLGRHYLDEIDQTYIDEHGESLRFENTIQRNVAIQEAATAKQTLFEYEPTHTAVEQYRGLVREIEARIENREKTSSTESRAVANG